MTQKKLKIKPTLDAESKAFYDKITSEFELNSAGRQLLEVACYTLTRWRQAKEILDQEGLLMPGNIARINPAAKIEHDARLSFARFLKELGLSQEFEQ